METRAVSEPKWGYLYVVKPKYKEGPFKIGIAGNLQKRLETLQTAHYEDLEVVMVVEMENPRSLEKRLHRRFREYRIRGEWFAANRYLHEALLALPGMYSPVGLRTDGLRPNRSWHAAHVSSESTRDGVFVKWPEWDETSTLAH